MRFIEDGANIPDELLNFHDAGQVVFICGSGVSIASASLPNFDGLAHSVLNELKLPKDDEVWRFYRASKQAEQDANVTGVFSPDRIFTLLERQFDKSLINRAVAKALVPENPTGEFKAHQTILKLARGNNNPLRLITTNFDLLFEHADTKAKPRTCSNLPHVRFDDQEWGIVHLHGCVTSDYSGAEKDGFILSSAEFGDAYLAQGWARNFISEVIERYATVFIGYSADDPPVRYLLEGLKQSGRKHLPLYAFEDETKTEALAAWDEKQVMAVPFSPDKDYSALWQTMEAWSDRVASPTKWQTSVLKMARKGPTNLKPHQRGMVAHIVSDQAGSVAFRDFSPAVPASWLCVFDRTIRYSNKVNTVLESGEEVTIDPFELYKLDSDRDPIVENDHNKQRRFPDDAWDAFTISKSDLKNVGDEHIVSVFGQRIERDTNMPTRISNLGQWIGRIADKPETIWWAARQPNLHKSVLWEIQLTLRDRNKIKSNSIARSAWFDIFRKYHPTKVSKYDRFELRREIGNSEWSRHTAKHYGECFAPQLTGKPHYTAELPPSSFKGLRKQDLITLDVSYPDSMKTIHVPDEFLFDVIEALRPNIEKAIDWENEISPYHYVYAFDHPEPEDDNHERFGRDYGYSGYITHFADLFQRLARTNATKARSVWRQWRESDKIFKRMRIWTASFEALASPTEFFDEIITADRELFWDSYSERDLMISLNRRWSSLSKQQKKEIEKKLLLGRARFKKEDIHQYTNAKNSLILNRLYWLKNQGCDLTLDFERKCAQLKEKAPDWREKFADRVVDTFEGRIGSVKTETSWTKFRNVPVRELINTLLKKDEIGNDPFTIHEPFLGVINEFPIKALSALVFAAKQGTFKPEFWDRFLKHDSRPNDPLRLRVLIASRLISLMENQFHKIIFSVCRWIEWSATPVRECHRDLFNELWEACISALEQTIKSGQSGVLRGSGEVDWMIEAIDSPAGMLASFTMSDSFTKNMKTGQSFDERWLRYVNQLLSLPAPSKQYALTIFASDLTFFYDLDPQYTKQQFLPILDKNANSEDFSAFWGGFFAGALFPQHSLFIALKPYIVLMAKENKPKFRRESENLSGYILSGWHARDENGNRLIKDDEIRIILLTANTEFRMHTLYHLPIRCKENKNQGDRSLVDFFGNVWPKQKSIRNNEISSQICEITFSQHKIFPELVESVIPLLSKIHGETLFLPSIRDNNGGDSIRHHPQAALKLLHTLLPDDANYWPYHARQTLDEIESLKPELANHPYMLELRGHLSRR